jgi:hypothetical protein
MHEIFYFSSISQPTASKTVWKLKIFAECTSYIHRCMARGSHGLPKVSPRPFMSYPSIPCGRAIPETVLQLFKEWPTHREDDLQPSSSHLDTLCHTPMHSPTPTFLRSAVDAPRTSLTVGSGMAAYTYQSVWQGVAMDTLKSHLGPLCPTRQTTRRPARKAGGLQQSSNPLDTPNNMLLVPI